MTADSQQQTVAATRMADYDYELPEELIAQTPLEDRSSSRLMVINRQTGRFEHTSFTRLGHFLRPGDLLVLNDSRVIPARLWFQRTSGGRGELLLLQRSGGEAEWIALARPLRKLRPGEVVDVLPVREGVKAESATIVQKRDDTTVTVRLSPALDHDLSGYGMIPLPPYITAELDDPERYQTVYSEKRGSAAAPTAGLHFTKGMLADLAHD